MEEKKLISLNKYVGRCGIGSRRKSGEFVKQGLITVNGTRIIEPGYKINPDEDVVRFNDKIIKPVEHVYLLLNKPRDYITTLSDERNRKIVIQLVADATDKRIYPVGRLDRNTTGLLVFTNDGQLTQQLAHPRYEIKKIYHVVLDQPLHTRDLNKISNGLNLKDGPVRVDKISFIPDKPKTDVSVELHSGRYRIVRRIFAHCGYEVIKLDRVNYAGLTKKGLRVGQWRFLSKDEVERLKSISV